MISKNFVAWLVVSTVLALMVLLSACSVVESVSASLSCTPSPSHFDGPECRDWRLRRGL